VTKRLTDIAISLMALLLLLPLLVMIAIGVKVTSPGPVIFKQRRYGLDGAEIAVYKFRSMRVTEGRHHHQGRPRRATLESPRSAPLLRRSSMDELPQLINVLQGRMKPGGSSAACGCPQ